MSEAAAPAPQAATPLEAAVGARIDGLTTVRHQIVPPVLLGLIMLFDSWDAVVVAQAMPALLREWSFGPVIAGTLISVGFAGQFIGAFAFGPFAERLGRLPVLFSVLAVMSLISLLCAMANSHQMLMALRFVQGLTIGGALPIAATYVSEIAPAAVRGRFFATFQVITMSGFTIAAVAGSYVIPDHGWRAMFALGAAPLVLLPVAALVLPESPRWLARRGRQDAANRALVRLGAVPVEVAAATAGPVPTPPRERTTPLALFAPAWRRRTLLLLAMWLLSSVPVFGISNWAPTIYTNVYGTSHAVALQYLAISGFCYLGLCPVAGALIDIFGRRPLSIAFSSVSVAALAVLAFAGPMAMPLPAVLLQVGSIGLSVMGSMILWPYSAENFPTRLRATALGFFSAMNRLAPMFVPVVIGAVLEGSSTILPVFILFAVCGAAVLLLWMFVARETRGIRLEDLERS